MNLQRFKPIIQRLVLEQLMKEKEQMRTQMATSMMAATLLTLHDKYDWQPEQLAQIMKEIFEQFDAVREKYVKIEDFYAELERMGIKVVDNERSMNNVKNESR